MAKTISTHNGSAAHRAHNIRSPWATDKQEHIDPALSHNNEILHDEVPREAYQRIFGKALETYNAKQSRPERQIRDYFSHIEKDARKHSVYEMIVQIGDRNDTGIDAPEERECLLEFYEGWKERNPNLECIGAYLHADESEGTLHMHIDYVPVATGYKNGMEIQSSLSKALAQQGFQKEGKLTGQIKWEARENAALEAICNRHGIEIIHPMIEKRKHLDTQTYKAQKELDTITAVYNDLSSDITDLERDRDYLVFENKNQQQAAKQAMMEKGYAEQKALEAVQRASAAQKQLDMVRRDIEQQEGRKSRLNADIKGLETRQRQMIEEVEGMDTRKRQLTADVADLEARRTKILTDDEVLAIPTEKAFLGGVRVSGKDWEATKRTITAQNREIRELKENLRELKDENTGLRQKVRDLERKVTEFMEFLKEAVPQQLSEILEIIKERINIPWNVREQQIIRADNERKKISISQYRDQISKEREKSPLRGDPARQSQHRKNELE